MGQEQSIKARHCLGLWGRMGHSPPHTLLLYFCPLPTPRTMGHELPFSSAAALQSQRRAWKQPRALCRRGVSSVAATALSGQRNVWGGHLHPAGWGQRQGGFLHQEVLLVVATAWEVTAARGGRVRVGQCHKLKVLRAQRCGGGRWRRCGAVPGAGAARGTGLGLQRAARGRPAPGMEGTPWSRWEPPSARHLPWGCPWWPRWSGGDRASAALSPL